MPPLPLPVEPVFPLISTLSGLCEYELVYIPLPQVLEYAAFVNEHIISIVMKASLKEGENPERIIIKSYNYNMASDKEVTLGELIELKKTDKNTVQKRIDEAIKTAYDNAIIIAEQFGNMYERDLKSDMYKVDSTEVYFLTDTGYIYVVYSYGNKDNTNVVDVIIF